MIDKTLLKNGDIFLFHTRGFSPISMAIRTLTESFWNHVGMIVFDIDKKIYCIESLGQGVIKTPIEKYLDEKHHILKVVRLRPEAFKDIDEYNQGILTATGRIWGKIGQKYDWWAIVWLGVKYGIRAFWNKGAKYLPDKFNPFQSRYKFFCSELVCHSCYNISTINPYLFQGKTKQKCDTTTPRDISKSSNVEYIYGKDKL